MIATLDLAIARDYESGLSLVAISARHPISPTGARNVLIRAGVPLRGVGRRRPHGRGLLATALAERLSGRSYAYIQKRLGVSSWVITRAVGDAVLAELEAGTPDDEIMKRYRCMQKFIDTLRRKNRPMNGDLPDDDTLRALNARDAAFMRDQPVWFCGSSMADVVGSA